MYYSPVFQEIIEKVEYKSFFYLNFIRVSKQTQKIMGTYVGVAHRRLTEPFSLN